MGCNCGGSTRRTPQQVRRAQLQAPAVGGGPGSTDYYWNGPGKKTPAPPATQSK